MDRAAVSAYLVFNYRVTDQEQYAGYTRAAMPTMAGTGVEVLVADYASTATEGEPGEVTVVLRFPTKEAAEAWYRSDSYAEAKAIRHAATTGGIAVLCDGLDLPPM
jgi:uncharacterized protein (DUF1330 family)